MLCLWPLDYVRLCFAEFWDPPSISSQPGQPKTLARQAFPITSDCMTGVSRALTPRAKKIGEGLVGGALPLLAGTRGGARN